MSTGQERTSLFGRETQRLVALTDGVFSIVMTLMVFNISLPKGGAVQDLGRALLDLWPNFLAFGISFGLVGIYWSAHSAMFQFIRRNSHELNWLNLLFLGFISLVPFSTTLVASHPGEPVALAVYGMNLTLCGSSLAPLWLHATKGRRLVDPGMPANVVRYGLSRMLVGSVGYLSGAALAFFSAPAALVVFAAVPWLYILPPVQRFWMRRFGLEPS